MNQHATNAMQRDNEMKDWKKDGHAEKMAGKIRRKTLKTYPQDHMGTVNSIL